MRKSRTTAWIAASVVLAGCAMDAETFDPAHGRYSKSELDALIAALEARVGAIEDCQEGDVLVRDADGWTCTPDPRCPPSFAQVIDDNKLIVVCSRDVDGVADADVIVRVGDFWIDRYEMSACPGGDVGPGTGQDTSAKGCSTAGEMPTVNITWFQAASMCTNAGKHLCTNAEWQTAASGTTDPGDCTITGATRETAAGTQCESRFGADDMIGNVEEWVADWDEAGRKGGLTGWGQALPWPAGHGDDQTWNVEGMTAFGASWKTGLPTALRRGGHAGTGAGTGTQAGAFAVSLAAAPSQQDGIVGARCCIGRQ